VSEREPRTEEGIRIPVAYVESEEVPILAANEFLIQFHRGGFILTIGQATPPPIIGSRDEVIEQVKQIPFIPVRVVGRFSMTEESTRALVDLLQSHIRRFGQRRRPRTSPGVNNA
jgi:hypothetical protein